MIYIGRMVCCVTCSFVARELAVSPKAKPRVTCKLNNAVQMKDSETLKRRPMYNQGRSCSGDGEAEIDIVLRFELNSRDQAVDIIFMYRTITKFASCIN